MSCTTMDHCYPQNGPGGHTVKGTRCFCGKRAWGSWDDRGRPLAATRAPAAPRLPRRRSLVRLVISGVNSLWFVDSVDREAGMFHVEGKGWHEPSEVIR